MASPLQRVRRRYPAPNHGAQPITSAQIARQQVLARALPALAHYHPGKSWGGAYIPLPAPSERQRSITYGDAQRLRAVVKEEGDAEEE